MTTEKHSGRTSRIAAGALLFVITLVIFLDAGANGFVAYDDGTYILDNAIVLGGLSWEGIVRAFTESEGANWHPITWLSHALDVQLFGLEPEGHHMTSVVLHAVNAVLAFAFLYAATRRVGTAFFVAALFAWHPLRVESVAWASERKDVLSGMFGLLTCLLWVRWAKELNARRSAIIGFVFALGLMSKPMLVSLPFVLLLLDRWPLARTDLLLREKTGLFVLAAATIVVTLLTQSAEGATAGLETFPIAARVQNAVVSCGTYFVQTFRPIGLAVFYPHAAMFDESLLMPALLWSAGIGATLALAYKQRAAAPWLAVGLGWFFVMLLPVIGIVQVGMQAHADRYTYLPSIGLATVIVLGIERFVPRQLWISGFGLALVALTFVTREQVRVWRDTTSLFEHASAVTERNYVAHHNLGNEYLALGDRERALSHYRIELEIRPGAHEVFGHVGEILFADRDFEGASDAWQRAHALAPDDAGYSLNLGGAYLALDRLELAEQSLQHASQAGEDGPTLHFDLGLLAQKRSDASGAEKAYRDALRRDPDHADSHNNLGQVLLVTQRPDQAAESFARFVELDPEDPIAHFNLGVAHQAGGRIGAARAAFRAALALDPTLTPASDRLGKLARIDPGEPGKPDE